jgi:hypothetical protein
MCHSVTDGYLWSYRQLRVTRSTALSRQVNWYRMQQPDGNYSDWNSICAYLTSNPSTYSTYIKTSVWHGSSVNHWLITRNAGLSHRKWDFWCAMWHSYGLFSQNFGFVYQLSLHECSSVIKGWYVQVIPRKECVITHTTPTAIIQYTQL